MKLELTENDVLLLKIAGSALIAFLIVRFLLMPGIERLQENTLERDLLDERVNEMELSIESIPVLEEAAEIRMKELTEISAPYYEKMENRQVDELLTGLALKHGLFPVSLSIDGAKPALPEPYLYGVTADDVRPRGGWFLRGRKTGFLLSLTMWRKIIRPLCFAPSTGRSRCILMRSGTRWSSRM